MTTYLCISEAQHSCSWHRVSQVGWHSEWLSLKVTPLKVTKYFYQGQLSEICQERTRFFGLSNSKPESHFTWTNNSVKKYRAPLITSSQLDRGLNWHSSQVYRISWGLNAVCFCTIIPILYNGKLRLRSNFFLKGPKYHASYSNSLNLFLNL